MEETMMLENKFSFKDEFGQETETRKTYTNEVIEHTPAIDLLVVDFVTHLQNCGYTDEVIVDTITDHLQYRFSEDKTVRTIEK
jgi:hypothetical protein